MGRAPVRIVVGLLLLTAAGLKAYQLFAESLSAFGLLQTGWLRLLLPAFEAGLGTCLLTGVYAWASWWAATALFAGFTWVSVYKAALRESSCGCFGPLAVNPWVTAAVDLALVGALWMCRPRGRGEHGRHRRLVWPAVQSANGRLGLLCLLLLGIHVALLAGSQHGAGASRTLVGPAGLHASRVFTVRLAPVFGQGDQVVRATIPVRNGSSQPVRFASVQCSCACSLARFTKEELQSGEETGLYLEVQMPRGVNQREIDCFAQTAGGDIWRWRISASSYAPIQFDDHKLGHVSLGAVDLGRRAEGSLNIRLHSEQPDAAPPQVTRVECDSPAIETTFQNQPTWEWVGNDRVARRRATIGFVLLPQRVPGRAFCTCSIHYGDRAEAADGKERVTVSWTVRPAFELQPRGVHLADGKPRAIEEHSIVVRRLDGAPLEIVSVASRDPAIAVMAVEPVSKSAHRLLVRIDRSRLPPVFYTEVAVRTNHPVQEEVLVPISGRNATVH